MTNNHSKKVTNRTQISANKIGDMASMRHGFGRGLVEAGKSDGKIVVLTADLAESTGVDAFKKEFPERFIEVGIAEQNLVTMASGMARMGKIPFVASYAIFSPGRNWEQIRTTITYNNLPVKVIGTHAGINVGPDGGSHQALEDIAIMRVLPRMVVISPCDANEAEKAAVAVAKTTDPTYIRLPREKSPIITESDAQFRIGRASLVYDSDSSEIGTSKKLKKGGGVGIIATGPILAEAILAAKKLQSNGKSVKVLNLSTIKPLDEDAIIHIAQEMGAIVTVEEHQIAGGMGSSVAECLSKTIPTPIEFVGIQDVYGQSGTSKELYDLYGLNERGIYTAAERAILRAK